MTAYGERTLTNQSAPFITSQRARANPRAPEQVDDMWLDVQIFPIFIINRDCDTGKMWCFTEICVLIRMTNIDLEENMKKLL